MSHKGGIVSKKLVIIGLRPIWGSPSRSGTGLVREQRGARGIWGARYGGGQEEGKRSLMRQLAEVFWHLEGVADGPPDHLGVKAVREGAIDGTPAELVEHEVLSHALRVHLAELRPHQAPEFRQPHAAQGTAVPDRTCSADKSVLIGGARVPGMAPETFRPMCRY